MSYLLAGQLYADLPLTLNHRITNNWLEAVFHLLVGEAKHTQGETRSSTALLQAKMVMIRDGTNTIAFQSVFVIFENHKISILCIMEECIV